uniref:C1q domain-containing protein n=1 Tax=Oncorhynchus tshawytscha TaxID=74940 RepID=A0AAZ3NYJ6_ONCTS
LSQSFSASLSETKGPFNTDITLVYKHAPVSGIYYFRFTAFGMTSKHRRVSLYKGGQLMVTVTDRSTPHDGEDSGSNGVTLQLVEGEEVYTRLIAEHQVYDDAAHHTTFTGFLISA